MSNIVCFQNETNTFKTTLGGLKKYFKCGTYGSRQTIFWGREDKILPKPSTLWVASGHEIHDEMTVDTINGQLVMKEGGDKFFYFFVSGARGAGHNGHKKLHIPEGVEVIAAGGQDAHTRGNCNKISSVVFRVPKGARKVVVADLYYGSYDHVLMFKYVDGEWLGERMPRDQFSALNPDWPGQWEENKDGVKIPFPAYVE